MQPQTYVALIIFLLTYASLSSRRLRLLPLERPAAALSGAVLMILVGVMDLEEAFAAISFDTLTLLLGMMILVEYLRDSGFFEWVARWMVQHSATPRRLLAGVFLISGLLSALFVNDTICLMLTPVVLTTARHSKLPPIPYLLALAMGANLGSAATFIGNPQNMLIGISSGIPFWRFTFLVFPAVAGGMLLGLFVLLRCYSAQLPGKFETTLSLDPIPLDRPLLWKSFIVTVGVLAGFTITGELATTALVGGTAMILLSSRRSGEVLARVDWTLILFFAGLFVVVGALQHVGLTSLLADRVTHFLGADPISQIGVFSLATLLLSNLFSNVPFVMIAQHWIAGFSHPELMWLVLAVISTFAGNLLLLGSVANLIVVEGARHEVHIGFRTYLKAGVPVTLVSCLWAVGVFVVYAMAGVL